MHIGVCMFNTDYAIRIEELARAAEASGFESLFVPEHTHIPASRRTPFPSGGELPREYSHTLDPFVALAHAAAVTTRIRLGTGICLVIERDTITTAKEVASVDFVSNGRFLFGIGGGWNIEEMENHGTDPTTRFKRLGEQVLAMKQIWTKEAAEFRGKYVSFDPIWMWPKPVQKPHPPVLLGGESGHTLQRVVDFCDGWFPRGRADDAIFTGLADLKARARRARPPQGGGSDARESEIAAGASRPGPTAPGSVRQAHPVSLDLPAWAAEFLRESRVARLGTADRAGRPLVVPVCYAFDGHACFSAIDAKPKRVAARALRRVRNIEQNPQVSLVVDRYDEDWARLCWVIVEGRADLLTEGPVRATAVDLLVSKYAQYRAMGLDRE